MSVPRKKTFRSKALLASLFAMAVGCALPDATEAQLRPIESMDWLLFEDEIGRGFVGVAGFSGQPLSLVGTEGRLVELGLLGASVRSGRIVLSLRGSAYRVFDASKSFAEPLTIVEDPSFKRRTDSGDYSLSSSMLLTSGEGAWDAAFRFGIRLPTTNDRVGLERDQTDFFTTVAGRYRRGPLALEFEAGAGINGVAASQFDQTDPILYGAGVALVHRGVESALRIGGQYDTRSNGPPRGNEHLSEVKLGIRSLNATWVQVEGIYGLAEFSPNLGFQLRLGHSF